VKYVLRVFDTTGAVQTVRVDSDSTAAAAAIARARGLRVVSVRGAPRAARWRVSTPRRVRGRFNVELFARELAALLAAGVSVVDALRTLAGNERRERSATV
jgi:general secretion pathway protein F